MTQKIHDVFAKEWMKEILADFGTVEIEAQVAGEVRTIDIVFYPENPDLSALESIGLLGRIVSKPCSIEAFHNAVPEWEVRNCTQKIFHLENALTRLAEKSQDPTGDIPFLWIITPTFSLQLQQKLRAETTPKWGKGIYFRCESDRVAIIAVHQLPKTLDTLWIRLLGKNKVQAQAVKELLALPPTHPYRQDTIRHIATLQINFQVRQNRSKEIKEVMMNLSPAYEQWVEETEARGEARGETRGQRKERLSIARNLLQEGASLALVIKVTGLTQAEVEELS
jgi:hypothetical protein